MHADSRTVPLMKICVVLATQIELMPLWSGRSQNPQGHYQCLVAPERASRCSEKLTVTSNVFETRARELHDINVAVSVFMSELRRCTEKLLKTWFFLWNGNQSNLSNEVCTKYEDIPCTSSSPEHHKTLPERTSSSAIYLGNGCQQSFHAFDSHLCVSMLNKWADCFSSEKVWQYRSDEAVYKNGYGWGE